MKRSVAVLLISVLSLSLLGVHQTTRSTALAATDEQFGVVSFPRDEHVHPDGWDFWWGAADVATTSGARYTVGIAYASVQGIGLSGHQVFPRQGPYRRSSILTQYGPAEWGHPAEPPGRYVRQYTAYVPGASELFRFDTIDTHAGAKILSRWERTTLEAHDYRFTIDDDAADIHPAGKTIKLRADLHARMRKPPLLATGDGRFWYGVPQSFGYPSRSFQYMQSAQTLYGSLEIEQPNGKMLSERVDPNRSTLVMIHEYDATPEDLPLGLGLALASELHPRFPLYYQGGMPWELLFADLRNGAQLFLALIAFQDTERGTLRPVMPNMRPTQVIATLRLPGGKSVLLDKRLRVEHLSYRTITGKVPTFMTFSTGIWKQAWTYRVSFPGGKVKGRKVPAFDIGFAPPFRTDEPLTDERGNAQKQRVPFLATGSYGGCPVQGFAWSEVIINWYRYESEDPWFTGGRLPKVPARC